MLWVCITWGFPKIRGTSLGDPIIRTIVFWGVYWGPCILGNYHVVQCNISAVGFAQKLKETKQLARR